MPLSDTDFEKTNLITTAKVGDFPTPESIRQGTVWMEYHPNYDTAIQKARNAGFEIRTSGFARVEWTEVYDKDGRDCYLLRIEKVLHVLKNMRYLDLEHELGHIDQFSRFGKQVPPTDKVVELPNGRRKKANIRDGILTTAQAAAMEYHNRLVEFIRLHERAVDMEVLVEHADGVDYWYKRYRKKLRGKRNRNMPAWVQKYFGEINDLEKQCDNIKSSLGM